MNSDKGAASRPTANVAVHDYSMSDYSACRSLWVELTEHHRQIYEDPTIGGEDPGVGFDDYLATPGRVSSWVAEAAGSAVGLTGLLDHGPAPRLNRSSSPMASEAKASDNYSSSES